MRHCTQLFKYQTDNVSPKAKEKQDKRHSQFKVCMLFPHSRCFPANARTTGLAAAARAGKLPTNIVPNIFIQLTVCSL